MASTNFPGEAVYDDGTCAICMGPHENKSRPPCGHVFCFQCLAEWCRIRQQCPMCNRRITSFKHSFKADNNFQVHQCAQRPHNYDRRQRRVRDLDRLYRQCFLFFLLYWIWYFILVFVFLWWNGLILSN